MLTVLVLPVVTFMERYRVPRWLAILLAVLGVVGAMVTLTASMARVIQDFTEALPSYQDRLALQVESTTAWLAGRGLPEEALDLSGNLDPNDLMGLVSATLSSVVDILSNTLLVALMLGFMLFEATSFPRKLSRAFEGGAAWVEQMSQASGTVQKYLAIKTVISMVTGLLLWGWVSLLGVDFPYLWGLLAFLLNYVPTIGSIIAAVPPVLVALVQLGPAYALGVGLGFLAVNITLGNILEPRLMGRRLGLSPLVVLLSLVFWGWLWGPAGMLLSVPLTVIAKILLEHHPDTRWVAVMLGPSEETSPPVAA